MRLTPGGREEHLPPAHGGATGSARAVRGPSRGLGGMSGFLIGATGMFATMYSTQAILPELSRAFAVPPARAGLTISAVVLMLAVGSWLWGPVSDRIGRRRSILSASALLVIPTAAVALAPTFPVLVVCRGLQGLCMPGLLTVGVPYVSEVFATRYGGRAMGAYVAALVAGGLLGRVGVGLVTAATGWRWAVGGLAVLPLTGFLVMRRSLQEGPPVRRSTGGLPALAAQFRNVTLLRAAAAAVGSFFTFIAVFSFITYRLEGPPFDFSATATSLLYTLWVCGIAGPLTGRVADRYGWRRILVATLSLAAAGTALTLPDSLVAILAGLVCIAVAMFAGVTAAQLGVAASTDVDRGVASAVYFSVYYSAGALAGYLPGLAWQAWGWPGVVILSLAALGAGLTVQAVAAARTRPGHVTAQRTS